MLQERSSQIIFKSITLPPVEGEEREYKDGKYKFEGGHWKKIKIEEDDGEIKTELYEKPDLEYPIYKVKIGDKEIFIQRQDEMNSGSSWYEVVKDKDTWNIKKDEKGRENWVGDTKKEAIDNLIKEYSDNLQEFPDSYNKNIEKQIWDLIQKDKWSQKGYDLFIKHFEKEIFVTKSIKNPLKFIIDLVGGIKSSKTKIIDFALSPTKDGSSCTVAIITNNYSQTRKINLKERILEKGLIDTVDVKNKIPGIAHKLFITMFSTAIKYGFKRFDIHAGGDYYTKTATLNKQKLNGYEHWGKMGFEIDKSTPEYLMFKNLIGPNFKKCDGILDLYAEPGGYDFWVKNGFGIDMIFDFKNQTQLNILKNYNNNYIKKHGL